MPRTTLQWTARVALVATAAIGVTAISGAAAIADDTDTPVSSTHTVEVFREVIKPLDSITIPSRSCDYGYLENASYSPGRLVPKGVEIVEPGGVGVTITHTKGPVIEMNGRRLEVMRSTDAQHSYSGATNWDPFTSREVVVRFHCTTDVNHAVVEDRGPVSS